MHVAFVYFDFMQGARGKYYEGLASLSGTLRHARHSTRLLHVTESRPDADVVRDFLVSYADARCVAFSATSHTFPHAARFAATLKRRRPDLFTVCGGPHATLFPEDAIADGAFDAICIGEGEHALRDLCDGLDAREDGPAGRVPASESARRFAGGARPRGAPVAACDARDSGCTAATCAPVTTVRDITTIPGLWVRTGDIVHRNPARPLIEDLDTLPLPDRELFTYTGSADERMGRVAVMGSRGCPFRCSHCCNAALRATYPNPHAYVRFKSVGRLLDEAEEALCQAPHARRVDFLDDVLNLKPRWFRQFAAEYKQRIGRPYHACSRFECLSDEAVALLRDSGCEKIAIGLEAGDPLVRGEVLNRRQSDELIAEVTQRCHAAGLRFSVFTMVGIPTENLERVLKTVKLAARMRPAAVQTSIFHPYPRTALHDLCRARGLLSTRRVDSYFDAETTLNLPDFPRRHVLFARAQFERFMRGYMRAERLPRPLRWAAQRGLDALWRRPVITTGVLAAVAAIRRTYRRHLGWRLARRAAP